MVKNRSVEILSRLSLLPYLVVCAVISGLNYFSSVDADNLLESTKKPAINVADGEKVGIKPRTKPYFR